MRSWPLRVKKFQCDKKSLKGLFFLKLFFFGYCLLICPTLADLNVRSDINVFMILNMNICSFLFIQSEVYSIKCIEESALVCF